jgi:hypothetical protein
VFELEQDEGARAMRVMAAGSRLTLRRALEVTSSRALARWFCR